MKSLVLFITAIGLLFPISSTSAQPRGRDITVQAEPLTPARWTAAVSRKLDRVIFYPVFFSNEVPASGVVSVRFQADDANRPTGLTLTRKSGNRSLDRAALMAIAKLGPLPALPAAFRSGQIFVARLLYATSWDEHDRQLALLRREAEEMRIASSDHPETVALVLTSSAGAGS